MLATSRANHGYLQQVETASLCALPAPLLIPTSGSWSWRKHGPYPSASCSARCHRQGPGRLEAAATLRYTKSLTLPPRRTQAQSIHTTVQRSGQQAPIEPSHRVRLPDAMV